MEGRAQQLKEKIKTLPEKPGIYKYFDQAGNIIYIGKAKNIKKRVNSYFTKNAENAKTRILVRKIANIEYLVVTTETDALLLENSLIKKYQPRYNIQLKDDKTYPWICIKNEPFPRVFSTRRVIKDGSKYFGPYPSVKIINTLLELINDLFPLRTCNYDLTSEKIQKGQFKKCLEFHIGNCKAPCEGLQRNSDYDAYIQQIEHIVKGNMYRVMQYLKEEMQKSAENYAFEDAAIYKAKMDILEKYQAKSTIVSPTIEQLDVITGVQEGKKFYFNYLVVNNGVIIHGQTIEVQNKLEEPFEQLLLFVLNEMRLRFNSNSKEVLVSNTDNLAHLENLHFFVPQRGDKKHLLDLSERNVKYYILEKRKQLELKNPKTHSLRILEKIQKDFRLKELPVHMECFDNSNFQGTHAVSACVVFKNGKPSKKDYRHFNIKTVEGPDDFASMTEAIYRRYKRLLEENASLPQLLIVDGGKGQLSAGVKALEMLNLNGKIPIVGIAKRLEEIFFPGDSLPLYLDKKSESLKVIQHMRNEAHRFGIEHHRNKRSKGALQSELENIKGIGPKTIIELLNAFKSIHMIKQQSTESIASVIGSNKAKLITNHFSEVIKAK
ncbi:MAG: excinuclease ABC subunit C [Crocinitomicaceae bacterium]|nr:excinuclease ABC subunit C [Crocinitomicaceae bacterium]